MRSIAYYVAGAATAPLLRAAPDLEFPSEEVAEGIEAALSAVGIPPGVYAEIEVPDVG